MKLGKLLNNITPVEQVHADLQIRGVQEDSRQVRPGDLFVAVEGLTVDGHDYAAGAVEAGAAAVVARRPLELSVPCLIAKDTMRALCLASSRLVGDPCGQMTLMGITGTNGKTTTTYMMESILARAGFSPGVIGTVGYRYAGREERAPFTTPTPQVLYETFARMARASCSHGVMEVSSHALQLGRTWGLDFEVAAFTHLTQDHLDLHGSMEAYLQAKLLLFSRHLVPGGAAVVNVDGHGAEAVVQLAQKRGDVRLVRCSTRGAEAEAQLREARYTIEGLSGVLVLGDQEVPLRCSMPGSFNGENVLLAAACCHAVGVDLATVAHGMEHLEGVPGRLERVDGGREFAVLVDYAHTPDALERAMAVLRPLCAGRLLVVFGCGGDRDRGKRPLMGAAVARQADLAVVTSDNPRTEDPASIIEAIVEGVRAEGIPLLEQLSSKRGYLVQQDRRRAIFSAVRAARPGDIVLIAGKGHEDYQILGRDRIHFDDREQAREALEAGIRI